MSEKIYRVKLNSSGMPNFSTAVEVADRPQGKWICRMINPINAYFECSECGYKGDTKRYNFCPNCGARMKGADDE